MSAANRARKINILYFLRNHNNPDVKKRKMLILRRLLSFTPAALTRKSFVGAEFRLKTPIKTVN